MSQVYLVAADSSTRAMNRVQCKSEDAELQTLLEKNYNLLPGDQIDPEAPRRWILIKREMPVPDPTTGTTRWSIDFLFADQTGIPTFVECKRYNDTRARREVIGQMLEYVANGQFYWTKEEMQSYADATALNRGSSLNTSVAEVQDSLPPDERLNPDEFFMAVQRNLREAQVRIVFFLEQSSMELRSLVDFLNKQMERTEVLLVEAKQYSLDGMTVVSPLLFGYTEQARQVKQSGRINVSSASPQRWNKESFVSELKNKLTDGEVASVQRFIDYAGGSAYKTKLGTGKTGSFGIYHPTIAPTASMVGVFTDGKLWIGFNGLKGSKQAEELRDFLRDQVVLKLSLNVPEDYVTRWPTFPVNEWSTKVEDLVDLLQEIESKYR